MKDGNIMANIITSHIAMNEAAAMPQLCPGILIHIIDMVQPPGMAIPPDTLMPGDLDRWIVPVALAMNRREQVARNACSRSSSLANVDVVRIGSSFVC